MRGSKRSKRSFSMVSVIFVLLAALAAGGFATAAEAADDPLAGNYSVLLKDRLIAVTANGSGGAFYNLTSADLSQSAYSAPAGVQIGSAISLGNSVRAVRSVGGYVADGAAGSDFYGTILPQGRRAVVASAYLVNTSTANVFDIYFTLMDKSGNLLRNASAFTLGTNVRVATVSRSCTCFSLVANDWNGDGYSDYILTYPTFTGTAGDPNSNGTYAITSVYVDGLTCYNAAKANTNPSPAIGTTHTLFSNSSNGSAAFNVSTAVGDVDGDGRKEFFVYYSNMIISGSTFSNRLDGSDIVPGTGDSVTFNRFVYIDGATNFDSYKRVGINYAGDMLAVAAGDFDGDGKDEVALLFTQSNLNGGDMDLSVFKNIKNVAVSSLPISAIQFYPRRTTSTSELTALAADLDGDGRDEFIWDYLVPEDINQYNLHIHSWPNGIAGGSTTDPGNRVDFSVGNFDPTNRSLVAMNYSDTPFDTGKWLVYGHNNWGGSNTGLLEMVPTPSFKTNGVWRMDGGTGSRLYAHFPATERVAVAAVDLYDESMVLGSPATFQIESVTPLVIMQAPPRHRDIVSGDFTGGGANPQDANGNSFPDAFFNLPNYATQYNSATQDQTMNSTTESSSVKIGVDLKTKTVVPLLVANASFSAGMNYANTQAKSSTSSQTYTTQTNFKSSAGIDDMIYANVTSYTMYRYPVLYPVAAASMSAEDGSGTGQSFLQFVSPTKTSGAVIPSSGRNFSWYEPDHDNYNLFTYPRDVTKVDGYPGGGTVTPPWKDDEGFVMAYQANMMIGTADASAGATDITVTTSASDASSVENTLGISTGVGAKTAIKSEYSLNLTQDNVWKTDSISKSDASVMKGVTINWPGMLMANNTPYVNSSGFRREDQVFYVDAAVYTRADGTLNTSYAVSRLKPNVNEPASYLWGGPGITSPYTQSPDPGLLLPFRLTSDGKVNTDPTSHTLRGLKFPTALFAGALPAGVPATGTFRVFNYSLVSTAGTIPYEVRYQPVTYNGASYSDAPDLSKATTLVASGSISGSPAIPGRELGNADNWKDVSFTWSNPPTADGSTGYVHVKLNYAGAQLSVDNDWGYYLYSFLDPSDLTASSAFSGVSGVSGVSRPVMRARDAGDIDLLLERVDIITKNGDIITDHGAIPQDEPFRLECHVALNGPVPPGKGAKLVFLDLFVNRDEDSEDDHGSLVASKHVPYLPNGRKHMFTIDYDPSLHRDLVDLKTLTVMVTSGEGIHESDLNPKNHIKVLTFADENTGPSGSGGGCDAGLGAALLAFGVFGVIAARRKRG